MAHFAELKDGVVQRVIVVSDKDAKDEERGIAFCKNLFGQDTEWVQTFKDRSKRKHYAGKGYSYNKNKDMFISSKPYDSWVLDDNGDWKAPVEKIKDNTHWNEETKKWDDDEEKI